MMKHMAPKISPNIADLAEKLHLHGDTEDRMESRRAFAEKENQTSKVGLNQKIDINKIRRKLEVKMSEMIGALSGLKIVRVQQHRLEQFLTC